MSTHFSSPDIEETTIGVNALLINKEGNVILQQRDNNPNIVNPGLIAMFGGTIHKTDTLIDGLKRELEEELELNLDEYPYYQLTTLHKTIELDGIDYAIHVYVINNVDEATLTVHEGKGYIVDSIENLLKNQNLTRITRLAIETLQSTKADNLGH